MLFDLCSSWVYAVIFLGFIRTFYSHHAFTNPRATVDALKRAPTLLVREGPSLRVLTAVPPKANSPAAPRRHTASREHILFSVLFLSLTANRRATS